MTPPRGGNGWNPTRAESRPQHPRRRLREQRRGGAAAGPPNHRYAVSHFLWCRHSAEPLAGAWSALPSLFPSLASLLALSSLTCQVSAVPNPPKACPPSAATSTGAYSWARDLTFLNLQCPRQKDQLRSWEAPDSSGVLPCLSLMARNSSSLQSSHTPSGYKSGILLLCKV